ncbi:hypothetical protein H9P43_002265 [Blastocladiella emersonii ATCC 22665]|nr:hypothetical protein H9P43_002265 [Blastocladiella emersonii ATCC 22665]
MSTMERRKQELELKRQKLEELRRAREQRRQASTHASDGAAASSSSTSSASRRANSNIDDLVNSVLQERPSSRTSSRDGEGQGLASGLSPELGSRNLTFSPVPVDPVASAAAAPAASAAPVAAPRPTLQLQASEVVVLDMAPVEKVYYSKELQTDDVWMPTEEEARAPLANNGVGSETHEVTAANHAATAAAEDAAAAANQTEPDEEQAPREIPEEIKKAIVGSEPFLEFFDHSSRIIEKALNAADTFDFLRDYSISADYVGNEIDQSPVKLLNHAFNDHYTKGRTVASIAWNPRFPELYVASYTKSTLPTTEADGLVLVWNVLMPTRPEFVFTCQSEVLTTRFSEFHPHLVIGGTYSGQIVLWDTRTKSSSPILKTPLSAAGHTHPVTSCALVGSEHAHQLVTASSDGTLCAWQLDMLAQPQEVLELVVPPALAAVSRHPGTGGSSSAAAAISAAAAGPAEVGVTCFAFPANEAAALWVGTEQGTVMHVSRYDRAAAKAGVADCYVGHYGMVTGLAFHPSHAAADHSDLFLTSSVDWTVKLWRTRKSAPPTAASGAAGAGGSSGSAAGANGSAGNINGPSSGTTASGAPTSPVSAPGAGLTHVTPLYSFLEAGDYVFDVAWSPTHPAVFAAVDGSGHLDLWNLNEDTELYVCRVKVAPRALNKVAFAPDGRRVAVGAADGHVYLYDLAEAAFAPREDDWVKFQRTLVDMEALEMERRITMSAAATATGV